MARFEGKHVLVTGGTSGIGLSGARRIVAEGGRVTLTGTDERRLALVAQELPAARVLHNDASDPRSVDDLVDVAAENPLDGLWLNAGFASVAPLEKTDADFFDAMIAVNVRAAALQLARLSPYLSEGASVVVTSSTSAYEGAPMTSVYAATKAAQIAAARVWAAELAPRGIRTNVLVPGATDTNFRHFMSEEQRSGFESSLLERVPLGRIGTSDEVAAVALFLLSDDASYVTGAQFLVDGGLLRL
ncbi:SDR family oxidoreductase [Micromonospora matsumotoense]|uniref:SDR family oxidoreductase n=1 Tax=Micromonospora matsumotoense TaxID=121616 RepID=UPI003D8B6CD6